MNFALSKTEIGLGMPVALLFSAIQRVVAKEGLWTLTLWNIFTVP